MNAPTRIGTAAAGPVSVQDAKEYLRVTSTSETVLIGALIVAATDLVSARVGRVLGAESWAWKFRAITGQVLLPVVPVRSLTSLTYLDASEAVQTANLADFVLLNDADRPALRPALGKSWPTTALRDDAITVTVAAGLLIVPPGLRVAILMLVAHWYQTREAVTEGAMAEVPMAVESLIGVSKLGFVRA